MSNSNLKIVQDTYTAFGRADIPAVLSAFVADAEIGIVGRNKDLRLFGLRKGTDGVLDFFKTLGEFQDISSFEPLRYLAAEDKVFVWGRYHWTMRRSGVSATSEWLHELTLKDGKVTNWRGHNDTAMLMEACFDQPHPMAGQA